MGRNNGYGNGLEAPPNSHGGAVAPNGNGNGQAAGTIVNLDTATVSAKVEHISPKASNATKIPGINGVYKLAQGLSWKTGRTPSGRFIPENGFPSDREHLAAGTIMMIMRTQNWGYGSDA